MLTLSCSLITNSYDPMILSTTSMQFFLNFVHSPDGLVKSVVEDDAYDVVDGFMLFVDSVVVVSVLDDIVCVTWMEDINITV